MPLIAGCLIRDICGLPSGMDGIRKRLGRNVARLRKDAGMSQETFADHVPMARSYISDIERGSRNPTIEVVERLAKALGVNAGSLLE